MAYKTGVSCQKTLFDTLSPGRGFTKTFLLRFLLDSWFKEMTFFRPQQPLPFFKGAFS
jgi:hypothetical protein